MERHRNRRSPAAGARAVLDRLPAVAPAGTVVYHNRFGRLDRVATGDDLDPDLCIAVVGERPYAEGVGDKGRLTLSSSDQDLVDRMSAECGDLVVIIVSGRPLVVTDLIDGMDALVAAWLPGTEGQGVADVLFGVEPFSATLPYTWPRSTDQLQDGVGDPLFPYGFGLQTG